MKASDFLSFVLQKRAFYFNGRLYFADELKQRGRFSRVRIDYDKSIVELFGWSWYESYEFGERIVVDGDVAITEFGKNIPLYNRPRYERAYQFAGRKHRFILLNNRIVWDTRGAWRDSGDILVPTALTEINEPEIGHWYNIDYLNTETLVGELSQSDLVPYDSLIYQAAANVYFTSEQAMVDQLRIYLKDQT